MQAANSQQFGALRNFLWPIHGHEHRKLIPMFCLFFLISFVYNVLRCMKVTLVVTAEGSGAEVIPFLKVWAVLPGAILLTFIYTCLANRLNREQVFYTMIGLFLAFFTLFMLVLHPYRESLELISLANFLQAKLPSGYKGLIAIVRHWPLSLFYVIGEMWSAIVLSILFWGFANEITSVDEAKRFYAIFALGANSSGIFSGQCAQLLTLEHYHPALPFGNNAWEQSLGLQLSVVLLLGGLILLLYRYVNRYVLNQAPIFNLGLDNLKRDRSPSGASKASLSLLECFKQLLKSPYMRYIAILVVAYNVVYNIADVLWTEQVRQHYPDAGELNAYMNQVASITGVFATLSALLLSGNVIRRYGWTVTAIITPLLWFLTGLGFLGCLLFSENVPVSQFLGAFCGMPLYSLTLIFGSAQICLGRAAKYTVFDESKEIAFIPLSKEDQRRGKAVVDGIGSRFGKSGGSLMIQLLLIQCGSLMMTIPYISAIFMVVLAFWVYAVVRLGQMASRTIDKELHSEHELDYPSEAKTATVASS